MDSPSDNKRNSPSDNKRKTRYWEGVSPGRPKTFTTPEKLWKAALKYFQWCDENPLYEQKAFAYQGEISRVAIEKDRPYTLQGLCRFINLNYVNYTRTYRKDERFAETCDAIDDIIRTQKFEGAAAGLFNAAIICRDLGLSDKTDHSSTDGSMTPKESKTIIVTAEDVRSILDQI